MQIHRSLDLLPKVKNAVITVGTYDGVHLGHQFILKKLKEEADTVGGESVIITFYPHPRTVISNYENEHLKLLNTISEKEKLLTAYGINHLVIIPFTTQFGNLSAEDYIVNFLVHYFEPKTIIIGYNHHFGKNRMGNILLLNEFAKKYNFNVIEIDKKTVNEIGISSSKTRNALNNGNVRDAALLLGYEYFIEGDVINGDKRGRTIGYPTANIGNINEDKLVPANGVYAVKVMIPDLGNHFYYGMLNIGTRPTFNGNNQQIEVHIFEFETEIYSKKINVFFVDFIRAEKKFDSIDELINQLRKDEINTRLILDQQKKITI